MNKINPKSLIEENPIFESLFAPLYFKAQETRHAEPIIKDAKSVEILDLLDYDFSYFEKNTSGQFLISVRTKILDEQVAAFIEGSPNPVIVNLGAGLDTRFSRLASNKIKCWYDLDLPEVIAFRKQFFTETGNHRLIGKSVLDYSWLDEIEQDGANSYLFIAEGLLMYFEEHEIKELFNQIGRQFPGSVILCEVFHSRLVNYNVQNEESNKDILFKWGISDISEIEGLYADLIIENEWKMFDYDKKRQKFFVRILCAISPKSRDLVRLFSLRFSSE